MRLIRADVNEREEVEMERRHIRWYSKTGERE